MDLGRLSREGIRKISRLTDRYRGLHEFLADVLEGERSLLSSRSDSAGISGSTSSRPSGASSIDETVVRAPFRIRDDVERLTTELAGQSLSKDAIFESLAPFFEAGFHLAQTPGGAPRLLGMFIMGRSYSTEDRRGAETPFGLPSVGAERVLRAAARPILGRLGLGDVARLKDASAFLFEPLPGTLYLLVCDRPHPWQVGMIERTYHALTELFAAEAARAKIRAKGKSEKKGLFR